MSDQKKNSTGPVSGYPDADDASFSSDDNANGDAGKQAASDTVDPDAGLLEEALNGAERVVQAAESLQQLEARAFFNVGIVGSGAPFSAFTRLVCRPDFTEAYPWVKLAGVACVHKGATRATPCLKGVPQFETIADLFAGAQNLNLVLDLSDDNSFLAALRRDAPAGCSVLNGDAAALIWELVSSEQLCQTCMRDLRRAQELFATLIDQVDEDILLLDTKGTILDLNRNVLERKGGVKSDYVGRRCFELDGLSFCCPPEDGGCTFRETLETGRKAERIHSRVNDSGKMQYFRIYTYPVFGSTGRINRIIEIRRDITHRTHMEQKLQQSEKMAAIGELSTYIAHEIRNPLFAIGGFANSLLRSPSLDDSAREKVEIILKESKRLDEILKTTLNFARPTDSSSGEIDVNKITAETIQLMRIGCEKRGFTATVDIAKDIARARGDADMVKQCLINLVKNAMEAMSVGGHLTVRTGMTQTNVFITVQDTGHGIPADMREKVFSPFFSTKEKGAGLGLAMTKKIIEEMGGFVELSSQEGVGTTVTLGFLPILAVAPEVDVSNDESDETSDGLSGEPASKPDTEDDGWS